MANRNAVGNALTGSTGTGTFVGATSPTLVTPILGKPTSGDLENCSTGSAWPFGNLLAYNGRFWTTANNFTVTISGGSFNQEGIFAAYNGSTFADGGRFYTDNSTNGGAGSAINTNVQDLLAAMARTGTYARYGVEFNLCSIVAGSGTTGSQTFPGATRYLLTSNSVATNGANSQVTFIGWVRAVGGTLGIRCSSTTNQQLYINGALQSQTNYDLATATGWVHVRIIDQNLFGYSAAFPGFYSQSGSSCLVACATVFNGAVNAGIHTSPIIGVGTI